MADIVGISTACFYPLETELSLAKLCDAGVKSCEVFFNTASELEPSFIKMLYDSCRQSGMAVSSVHPYSSFAESYGLFSTYNRRFKDTLEQYKRYFPAMNKLGARVLVIHGAKPDIGISDEEFFERFGELVRAGAEQGCIVAQENVVYYKSESPEFLVRMKNALGSDFHMVLDNKQALRAGFKPSVYIDALAGSIVHVHLSDSDDLKDCIPPGEGTFDYPALFCELKRSGYTGDYTVELYSKSFKDESQIYAAREHLQSILCSL